MRGSGDGFREAFEATYPTVAVHVRKLTRDPELAEDIAAETMTRLYARWWLLRDRTYRTAWVLRVATNLSIDALRKRGRLEPAVLSKASPAADADVDRFTLIGELRRLPRRQRQAVALRYLADMSEADIAAALGITQGAVKSHLHRGLAQLRKNLIGETPTGTETASGTT